MMRLSGLKPLAYDFEQTVWRPQLPNIIPLAGKKPIRKPVEWA
jgi:hypothetical protein